MGNGKNDILPSGGARRPCADAGLRDGGDPASSTATIAVALFNLKYSPNLGDGVIAECLESGLRRAAPELAPESIDLSGRTEFSEDNGRNRRAILTALELLPGPIRQKLLPVIVRQLVDRKLAPAWRRQLGSPALAIIGGGALLADMDQNFPIKLSAALQLCAGSGIPVAISHVGVSPDWSRQGARRFLGSLAKADLRSFTVRDERSRDAWYELLRFAGMDPLAAWHPTIVPDPGLLANEVYGTPATSDPRAGAGGTIGLCITAPQVLRLHGTARNNSVRKDWEVELIRELLRQDSQIVLFTNGSPEDHAHLRFLAAAVGANARLEIAPRFTRPRELAHFIASLDVVVAHRLHACIVAHSYGVPALGLAWDPKLRSYFNEVGRENCFFEPSAAEPSTVAGLAGRKLRGETRGPLGSAILDRCRAGVADLANLALRVGEVL